MYSRYVDDGTIVVKSVTDCNEEMNKKETEKTNNGNCKRYCKQNK